jgi:hypothetical protein
MNSHPLYIICVCCNMCVQGGLNAEDQNRLGILVAKVAERSRRVGNP